MTKAIQKNIPFKLLDAVTPSNALASSVYALPAVANFIEVVASLSAAVATETVTVSVYGAEDVAGPFVLINSALVPANATNINQSFSAFLAFTHIKVVLSAVTIVSSTLTVTVNAKAGQSLTNFIGSINFIEGFGLSFQGPAAPITMVGGDDGFGDTAIIFDNTTDDYLTFVLNQYTDFWVPSGFAFYNPDLSSYFYFDGDHSWELQGALNIVGSDAIIDNAGKYRTHGTITTNTLGYDRRFDINPQWAVTGGSTSDSYVGVYVNPEFGSGGVAQKGTMGMFSADGTISGSGDATNEFSGLFIGLSMNIGAGFTQTLAPTGNLWMQDLGVHSAIGLQTGMLSGITQVVNQYFNGSPSLTGSYCFAAVTDPGHGAGINATHSAATSYAIDDGFIVSGRSGTVGSPTGTGFTRAFRVGNVPGMNSTNWQLSSSKILTGYYARDVYTYLADWAAAEATDAVVRIASDDGDDITDVWYLKVLASGNSMTWTNDVNLVMGLTTAGLLSPVTIQPTTAYNAVDSSPGISTTVTTASLVGKTITFKNGLVTAFA